MTIFLRGNPFQVGELKQAYIDGISQQVESQRVDNRLWASSAGHCARKEAFKTAGINVHTIRPEMELYQKIGVTVEETIKNGWYQAGNLLFSSLRTPNNKYNLGGEIDAVVIDSRGKIRLVEIKTTGRMPDKPKPVHYSQAMLYSALVGFPATLLYQSRNVATYTAGKPDLDMEEFPLPFTVNDLERSAKTMVLSYLYSNANLNPPKPANYRKTVECQYCDFTGVCYGGLPFPYSEHATEKQIQEFDEIATLEAKIFIENMADRRVGVLKHISLHGTEAAKKLLQNSDWKQFYTELE